MRACSQALLPSCQTHTEGKEKCCNSPLQMELQCYVDLAGFTGPERREREAFCSLDSARPVQLLLLPGQRRFVDRPEALERVPECMHSYAPVRGEMEDGKMEKKMTDEMMQGRAQGPDGLQDRAEPQGQARLRDCSTRGSAVVGGGPARYSLSGSLQQGNARVWVFG